jgi:hypothetical protein
METLGQDQIKSRRYLMGYSRNTSRCRWKMNEEKASTCKKSITGLVGCGAVSGIKNATNEKAISGSCEAKNVVPIVRNVLR